MSLTAGATDMVLAAVAWAGVASTARRSRPGDAWAVGFAVVAAAATIGALRFLALESLAPLHHLASLAATIFGLPMLAVGAVAAGLRSAERSVGVLAVGAAGFAVAAAVRPEWVEAVSAGAVIAGVVGGAGLASRDRAGGAAVVAGFVGVAIAGWWIGPERAAGFHLALAASLLALGGGASRSTEAPLRTTP